MSQATFVLIDCNNFFVSCEQVFRPEIRNKPVVVLSANEGCVISRSNEAKALGIAMGAPAFKYRELFRRHKVTVLPSHFSRYGEMSQRVMMVLATFSPDLEMYSVDEAFLEVGGQAIPDLAVFGRDIHRIILQWTGIPVAVGIAPTKTLAKVAATLAKKSPEFMNVLNFVNQKPAVVDELLARLPVEDVWGVGYRTAPWLKLQGIMSARDLKYRQELWVRRYLKLPGLRMWRELSGETCFELEPERQPKQSIAVTRTFKELKTELFELEQEIAFFAARAAYNLRRQCSVASSMTVFIQTNRYAQGEQYRPAVRMNLPEATAFTPRLIETALQGLRRIYRSGYGYKRAGVTLGQIAGLSQLNLFMPARELVYAREQRLLESVDRVAERWGRQALRSAAEATVSHKNRGFGRGWIDLPTLRV